MLSFSMVFFGVAILAAGTRVYQWASHTIFVPDPSCRGGLTKKRKEASESDKFRIFMILLFLRIIRRVYSELT